MRIGHGYDVHKLVKGRKLILGGVRIVNDMGLLGHSDADVLTHAIMDSLLGSLALGDIGKLFPDTDERYKGANSIDLLRQVARLIEQKGYRIVNIDATICAQKPKLAGHINHMRFNSLRYRYVTGLRKSHYRGRSWFYRQSRGNIRNGSVPC